MSIDIAMAMIRDGYICVRMPDDGSVKPRLKSKDGVIIDPSGRAYTFTVEDIKASDWQQVGKA